MRIFIIIYFFSFLSVCAQKTALYEADIDSISGKYGFVDSTENYIISPKFDKLIEENIIHRSKVESGEIECH